MPAAEGAGTGAPSGLSGGGRSPMHTLRLACTPRVQTTVAFGPSRGQSPSQLSNTKPWVHC